MNGDFRRNGSGGGGGGPPPMMHGDRGGAGPGSGSGNGSGPNPYGGGGGPGGGGGGPPPGERRRGRRDDTPQGVSLLVRNLSTDITSSDLQAAFRRIGEIKDVYIPLDYHSKLPKGFAFIEFATPDQARNARDEMNRFLMKGRELEVVYAQEKRKTPGEMRVRTDSPERGDDGGGGGGSGGDGGFERSSSFERHRRREDDMNMNMNRRRGRPGDRSGSRDYGNGNGRYM